MSSGAILRVGSCLKILDEIRWDNFLELWRFSYLIVNFHLVGYMWVKTHIKPSSVHPSQFIDPRRKMDETNDA